MSDHGEEKQRRGPPGAIGHTDVEFPCPFCGAACATIVPPGVLHAMPPCPMFIKLSPIAFLQAANEAERRKN